jgi:mitotic spindle assembly checkpoint protein MAD1
VLRRCEAELADALAREIDARATADAHLQATRAAEDRATRAERAAALSEREIGFLQALNVRSHPQLSLLILHLSLACNK